MEKRVELEKRGKNPEYIKDLNLDNCRSTSIVGLTDEFVNLVNLSLINVGLTSLKGFPKLPNLKKLELSDNRISNGLNLLSTSPKLTHLNLSGNKIKDLEALQPLKEFKHLKSLDLFNNEATSIDNYREKIFNLIPSLKCLDGYDTDDEEVDDSECEEDEVNGNANASDEEEGSSATDDFDDDIGLQAVYDDDLEDMSDVGDYQESADDDDANVVVEEGRSPGWVEDEEADGEPPQTDDAEAEPAVRGKKRKIEEGDSN